MGEIASGKDAAKEHNPPVVHESATVAGSTTARRGAVPETSPTAGAGARAAWMRQLQRSVGNARAGAMAAVAAGGADTQTLAHELTRVVVQQRHDPVEGADHGGALKVSDPSDRGEQAADVPPRRSAVHDVLRGSGQPLTGPLKEEMEARLGADFSKVRLHTDARAQRSAAELGARAFTSGSEVVLGEGGADKHALAHELTHVIQQREGPVAGTDMGNGLSVSDPSDRFEKAAESNASRVMRSPHPAVVQPVQEAATDGTSTPATVGKMRAVQRMIWWKTGVKPPVVDSIKLQRPPGSGGGKHSAAYQLFVDTVQNAVINVSYEVALKRVKALVDDAKDLPGWVPKPTTPRGGRLPNAYYAQQQALERFNEDYKKATSEAAVEDVMNQGSWLETICDDYLALRNTLEFTLLKGKEGGGPGGEAPAIAKATEKFIKFLPPDAKEQKEKISSSDEFKEFIDKVSKLLDITGVSRPGANQPAKRRRTEEPTKQEAEWVGRWQNTIQQFIATVIVAFPGIEAVADVIIERLVQRVGGAIGFDKKEMNDVITRMTANNERRGWRHVEELAKEEEEEREEAAASMTATTVAGAALPVEP